MGCSIWGKNEVHIYVSNRVLKESDVWDPVDANRSSVKLNHSNDKIREFCTSFLFYIFGRHHGHAVNNIEDWLLAMFVRPWRCALWNLLCTSTFSDKMNRWVTNALEMRRNQSGLHNCKVHSMTLNSNFSHWHVSL